MSGTRDAIPDSDHLPDWTAGLYRVIRATIAQGLGARYEVPQELPPVILVLLGRMDEQHDQRSGPVNRRGFPH
jgi:hypothetical protein